MIASLRASFNARKTRSIECREAQLKGLRDMLVDEETALIDAIRADIKESPFEAYITDIGSVVADINHTQGIEPIRHSGNGQGGYRRGRKSLSRPTLYVKE